MTLLQDDAQLSGPDDYMYKDTMPVVAEAGQCEV